MSTRPAAGLSVMRLARAGLVTAVVGAALTATVIATRATWIDLAPATCLPDGCFCEAVRLEGLAQPVNSITSLAYVVLGVWALLGGRTLDVVRAQTRTLVRAAGAALVALGVGSFVYHATLTLIGQVLDVQGMYLLGALILLAALVRRGTLRPGAAPWLYVATCTALAVVQVAAPESRRFLFAVVLLPGIILEGMPGTTGVGLRSPLTLPYRSGVVLLVVAYGAWLLDNAGIVCWPTSVVQGHGLWHILTAVAAVLVVSHYLRTPGRHQPAPGDGGSGPRPASPRMRG